MAVKSTAEAVEEIREQGYTILERVLPEEEISRIKAALSPWLQGELLGRNNFEGHSTERVYALLAKDPVFALIVEHPRILGVVDELLEPDYLLSANLAINVRPGETPQPFHRDNDGGNFGSAGDFHGVSAIWAFDDFTSENGATELIPGSHLNKAVPPGTRSIKAEMPAGSVLVFSGNLVHRGGANNSNATRLAITPQYCQPWLRQLENMVLSVPPDQAAKLSGRVQSLLGYSIRTPGFMGYVDGMHPKRLIDHDFQGRKARGEPS